MRLTGPALALPLALTIAHGCSSPTPGTPSTPAAAAESAAPPAPAPPRALVPVALPDITSLSPAIREQLASAATAFTAATADTGAPAAARAQAYGDYGLLLMSAGFLKQAEPCFLNAEFLAPTELRWPYYLGHIYRRDGHLPESLAAFERASTLDPSFVPALVWVGHAYLEQAQPDEAAARFARAATLAPDEPAVTFGLGRVAMARGEAAQAVTQFERTLSLDPQAIAAHYPLSQAYRQLGNTAKADAHLRREVTGGEVRPRDPLDVQVMVEAAVAYEVQGARALQSGDWKGAAAAFTKGVSLAPEDPNMRHKLATALALTGDRAGATRELTTVTKRWPAFAKGHYSLGLIVLDRGNVSGAIDAFRNALRATPTFVEARLQLAHALRRSGKPADAVPEYDRVVELDSRVAEARFGAAMALVALQRYTEAADRLSRAAAIHPEEAGFPLALARILSAAPDVGARSGGRALALLEGIPEDRRRIEWGVVHAMALAEAGRFDDAVLVQKQVIGVLERNGAGELARRQQEVLRRYEQKQPSRTPWGPDEAMELPDMGPAGP